MEHMIKQLCRCSELETFADSYADLLIYTKMMKTFYARCFSSLKF